RRHTRFDCDWSSDVCSSDLTAGLDWRTTSSKVSAGPRLAYAPRNICRDHTCERFGDGLGGQPENDRTSTANKFFRGVACKTDARQNGVLQARAEGRACLWNPPKKDHSIILP